MVRQDSKQNGDADALREARDPLLACLVTITQLLHMPQSEQSLLAGMPLEDGQLTPDIFIRAAERVNISASMVERDLTELTADLLPAVVLLNDGQACVVVDCGESGVMQILQPGTAHGARTVDVENLLVSYTGHLILVKKDYRLNGRSEGATAKPSIPWFWQVIYKAWPIYAEVLVASFLINLFALAVPLFVMNVYDRVVPNHAVDTLWVLGIGVFIVLAFDFTMRLLRGYFIDEAGKGIDIELSSKIFSQLMGLTMSVRPQSVGALANTVHAFESFREFITSASVNVLIDLPFVILFIAVIAYIGGSLAVIPLILVPLVVVVSLLVQWPMNKKITKLYRLAAEKQATLYESLGGVETVKATSAEGLMQQRWEEVICESARIGVKIRFLSSIGINMSIFSQAFATVAVVIAGVYKIAEGDLTVGALVACTILTGRALAPASQLAGLCSKYFQSVTAVMSLDQIMQAPVERPRQKQHLSRGKLAGEIEFKDVGFRYPLQSLPALDNVSFRIAAGEKVAIVGRIGSGKSTIEKLILKLYAPSQGHILMDGIDITQLDPVELRQQIAYVPQDIVLFYGSVRDNIAMSAPYVDDETVLRAAKRSGVDQFVNLHPDGFDMDVGEKGSAVSGGQRQAIAIARALLLEPSVLVMDEPTNAMDDRSELYFKQQLADYMQDKTLLLVTHRPSMLSLVDRIIVLDRNRVVADGAKADILAVLSDGRIKVS